MPAPRKSTADPQLTAAIRPVAEEISAYVDRRADELTDELVEEFSTDRRILRAAIYYLLAADLLPAELATIGRRLIDDASQRGDHQKVGDLAGVGRNGVRYAFDRRAFDRRNATA